MGVRETVVDVIVFFAVLFFVSPILSGKFGSEALGWLAGLLAALALAGGSFYWQHVSKSRF